MFEQMSVVNVHDVDVVVSSGAVIPADVFFQSVIRRELQRSGVK